MQILNEVAKPPRRADGSKETEGEKSNPLTVPDHIAAQPCRLDNLATRILQTQETPSSKGASKVSLVEALEKTSQERTGRSPGLSISGTAWSSEDDFQDAVS